MKKYWAHKENLLLAAVWMLVYAFSPLYMWYASLVNHFPFRWGEVCDIWMLTTAFLILFIIHHVVLVPRLFLKKRYTAYGILLAICMSLFLVAITSHHPFWHFNKEREPMHEHSKEPHHQNQGDIYKPHAMPRDLHEPHMLPHGLLSPPDIARMIIALMMIGVDLGLVAWINSHKLRQRLLLLEKQNLKQELEHLRYQINPHFFMNTLNNIHVLVDVNKERAKRAIIELSGLMRHSLYNGRDSLTTLQSEIDFLKQYISLMELRFGNRVAIKLELPEEPVLDVMIPPLLFATFVENAFKHGVSYQHPSFINISVYIDGGVKEILFMCENSYNESASTTQDGYHGIGLNNVRKRLDLQYGDTYTLKIDKHATLSLKEDDSQPCFAVSLILPFT